jgi:hypothetical protein
MVQCKALCDGLVKQTQYVRAGELFFAEKCPSWAEPMPKVKKAVTDKKEQEGN